MKSARPIVAALAILGAASAAAEPAVPRTARFAPLERQPPDSPERLEIARVQTLLDRAGFGPGKIDALGGEFTQRAADRYCIARGLPPGSRLDTSAIASPYREYVVAAEDAAWIGKTASRPAEQEKLKRMPYASSWEALAERFHCDIDFLQELNPAVASEPAPGVALRVPDVEDFRMADVLALEKKRADEERARRAAAKAAAAKVAADAANVAAAAAQPRPVVVPLPALSAGPPQPPAPRRSIVLLREPRMIEVYEEERLIAAFPCTPGSTQQPVPVGRWKITSNILMPHFRWDKSVLESGVRSANAFNIPPGPNNPVGVVWMGLNRPSVGMHGTTSPDQIGRNESHGCIRLANWDAFRLAQLVGKGTPVEVR